MNAILLIIDIVYGVCRIVIKSVQQCTKKRIAQNFLLFRKQRRKSPPITYTRGIMTLRLFPIQDGHLPDEV
jgi:hypothetical protein